MILNFLAKLVPYAAIGLLAFADFCACFALVIVATSTTSARAGITILFASVASVFANFLISGYALWSGSRGLATLGLILGHVVAVVLLGSLLFMISAAPSDGAPSGLDRRWIHGPLGVIWMLAIVASFLVVDGLLLIPLWPGHYR